MWKGPDLFVARCGAGGGGGWAEPPGHRLRRDQAGIARRRALAPEIVGGPPTAELRALFRGPNLPRPSRHGTFNPTALQALGPTALQDDDRHRGLVPRALDCDSGVDWAMADSVVTSVDEKGVFDADTMPHDHTT